MGLKNVISLPSAADLALGKEGTLPSAADLALGKEGPLLSARDLALGKGFEYYVPAGSLPPYPVHT
jgi:hypothetical protein